MEAYIDDSMTDGQVLVFGETTSHLSTITRVDTGGRKGDNGCLQLFIHTYILKISDATPHRIQIHNE